MSAMNAQVKIDDVSALAAEVRALREEIRRLRESTPQSLVDLKAGCAPWCLDPHAAALGRCGSSALPASREDARFPLAALNPR